MRFLFFMLFVSGCVCTENHSEPPSSGEQDFADDWESYAVEGDMFPLDETGWHGVQLTNGETEHDIFGEVPITDGRSTISLEHEIVHSGVNSIRFDAGTQAKCDLQREAFFFEKGDTFVFDGWFWIQGDKIPIHDKQSMPLMDIEAPHQGSGGPGRRIMFDRHENGTEFIFVNSKGSGDSFRPPWDAEPVPFPREQWVHVRLELYLSEGDDGRATLWQDDEIVVEASGQTLTCKHSVYHRLQLGATFNATDVPQTVIVDDVVISSAP